MIHHLNHGPAEAIDLDLSEPEICIRRGRRLQARVVASGLRALLTRLRGHFHRRPADPPTEPWATSGAG